MKATIFYDKTNITQTIKIYNLVNDPNETNKLADSHIELKKDNYKK